MPENNDNDSRTETSDSASPRGSSAPKLDRIGVFRVEKALSSGGGGTVYLAFDESMKRRVALKVLHPSLSIAPKAQERFAREAWIAGQLEHSNIIRVHSRGEENQLNYIAMEYAEGGSLSDYIKQLRIEAEQSKDITTTANREHIKSIVAKFIELANALEYIHSKGFIHRDIKPHNILLAGPSKQLKLTDFGIAHADDMTKITRAGDFFGTVHYMSPEQITAHRTVVDKRTDIYSLGVSLYEALTLSLPFEGDSEEKLIGEIISGHYIPARKRLRHIPKDLETILMKATHFDPSRRYQSAKEFGEDLSRFADNRAIAARRDSIFYKAGKNLSLKRRSNQIALAIILLLAVSGIVVTKVQQDRYDKEKILTSLKRAVETKTSPFEFEPEWPRLSKKLYEHVKKAKLDSTMIWFLKSTVIPIYDYAKYFEIERTTLSASISSVQIFEQELVSADTMFTSVAYMENGDKIHFFNFFRPEPNMQLKTISPSLSQFKDYLPGEISLEIKTISEHFLGAGFYIKNIPLIRSTKLKGKVLINDGDSLMLLGVPNAYAWKTSDFVVLDRESLKQINPIFADTIIDTTKIFCFDTWPKDFPKRITSSSLRNTLKANLAIDKCYLIKNYRRYGSYNQPYIETSFAGTFKQLNNTIPVAGFFEIRKRDSNDLILKGTLVVGGRKRVIRFDDGSSYFIDHDLPDSTARLESVFFYSEDLDSSKFEAAKAHGKTDAELIVFPSLEVARDFGYIINFFGDTLRYDVIFQAIDSTGFPVQVPTNKELEKHVQTILFDSTFLINFR